MNISPKKMLIGVSGLNRSGKDSLAEYLINEGYFGVSLGDIVRNETRIRHASKPVPISVENLTETSNWLRMNYGPKVVLHKAEELYQAALDRGEEYEGLVLFSVRVPVEVDYILEHGGQLIWVEASDEIRYQRTLQHLREGEAEISLEEFKRQENLQITPQPGIPVEVQMNLEYVKSKATKTIVNEGTLEEFEQQIVAFLQGL